MKKFYGILLLLALMAFKTNVQAQTCTSVTAELTAVSPQSEYIHWFGVKVSLAQPYTQNVTVGGTIMDTEGASPSLWQLTILAGSLTAETSPNFYSTDPQWSARVSIDNVTPCPPSVQIVPVNDPLITNTMMNSFNSLNVDLSKLSTEAGLSSTITANDIDFQNLYRSYDANSPGGIAITAPFKNNSSSNSTNYGFTLFTDGTSYIRPTLIVGKTNVHLKYFDLDEGLITTINNYNLSTYSISTVSGNYMISSSLRACGQATANCIADVYVNHGWLSVWAQVQSFLIPETGVAIAGVCAIHSCLSAWSK